ncbi:MAG: ankyrin repeat domain-containing protein [Candidatus Gastranaerophilales bacterium]|nr:ankyrin repeat domain-containing protein [Candidatus Gastranaerophilales bacterium]
MKKILALLSVLFMLNLYCGEANAAIIIPKAIAEQIEVLGYSPSEQGFFEAAKNGDIRVLGLFMEANAYVNLRDEMRRTPVYYAAENGQEKAVQFLLLYGADINIRDENMKSPLMAAIEAKSYPTAKLLLDVNANVQISDDNGRTPLHYAVMYKQTETAQAITNKFCDVDSPDNDGNTPLFYAFNKIPLIRVLLRAGADINGLNNDGKTVLHQAVITNNLQSAKFLIENGANVNIKDQNGHTPIFYTEQNSPLYMLLLESGAKI